MEKCLIDFMALSPLRKVLEYAKEKNDIDLIVEVEMMLDEEEEVIKSTYRDAVDFVVIGLLHNEKWPTADEYFEQNFTP
jgi:hypothetical protein